MNKNATKRHYKPQKILVKYIVKVERQSDPPTLSLEGKQINRLIVFFPGDQSNRNMIGYMGCSVESPLDGDYAVPDKVVCDEAHFNYYLECKPAELTEEQVKAVEARILQLWPEKEWPELELKRVTKVTKSDRDAMWGWLLGK